MKILFIIPPTDLDKSYGGLKSFSNPQPSLGIAYIAAVLMDSGYDVMVMDAYVSGYTLPTIVNEIKQFAPDFVGISVLTASAEIVYKIAKAIRLNLPDTKIVMGNLHASLFSSEILLMDYADFVVHGEGELTMLELLRALENKGNFENVQGISFKRDGTVVNNPLRPLMEDLDSLPFPPWHIFPMEKYATDPRTYVKKNVVETMIISTRGCPNQCTFCSTATKRSLGVKYRMRKPGHVIDEMIYMNKRYGSSVFAFMDMAFPLVRAHAIELCNEIIDRGYSNKFKWVTECRVNSVDEDLLKVMKRAGCVRICFGIESGNNETLKLLKKNFSVDDVKKAVKMVQNTGIEVDGMFMMGLPGENEGMIRKTVSFAIELDLRYAIFNIFVPYPGSELYDRLSADNKIHFNDWSDFTSYPTYSHGTPVYVPDSLTHEKLMHMQRYAMNKFYLRPRFVFSEMKRLKLSKIKNYYLGLKGLFSK